MIFRTRSLRRFALRRLDRRIDPEQSRIARRVGKRGDAEGQSGFFAHAAIKARAAAIAENGRKQIERGHIGMRDLRNVPGERKPRQLRRKFLVRFASCRAAAARPECKPA